MATEILASGVISAQSSTFVLADGASSTLILKGNGSVDIQIAAASGYVKAGVLDSQCPVKNVTGPGTFRVSRDVSGFAVGVDKE